jgi:hypothetical protein
MILLLVVPFAREPISGHIGSSASSASGSKPINSPSDEKEM